LGQSADDTDIEMAGKVGQKRLCLITSNGGNTCPILTFSGFAESPDPSASFTYGQRDNRRMA